MKTESEIQPNAFRWFLIFSDFENVRECPKMTQAVRNIGIKSYPFIVNK
jgi:hypothetical protein